MMRPEDREKALEAILRKQAREVYRWEAIELHHGPTTAKTFSATNCHGTFLVSMLREAYSGDVSGYTEHYALRRAIDGAITYDKTFLRILDDSDRVHHAHGPIFPMEVYRIAEACAQIDRSESWKASLT
jgi:hypothetical protein